MIKNIFIKFYLLHLCILFCISRINTIYAQDDIKPYPGYSGMVMLKTSKWPANSSGKTVINVSWENPSHNDEQERAWVREAIRETWEKHSNIEFIGWGKSNKTSDGIRIVIDDYGHPHCKGLGTQIDGKSNGMLLNFNFRGNFKCLNYSRENCIKYVAVHEFGHALGFAHEHNRLDCKCASEPQGTTGDLLLTDCDPNSVMNYCNPKWSNWGDLSTLDKKGLVTVYGVKTIHKNNIVHIDEIRLIPCASNSLLHLHKIRSKIDNSSSLSIKKYTEETLPIPQRAIDNLANAHITVRYFHPDDKDTAYNIKYLLAKDGYSVEVQDMMSRMSRLYPKYIEIWSK